MKSATESDKINSFPEPAPTEHSRAPRAHRHQPPGQTQRAQQPDRLHFPTRRPPWEHATVEIRKKDQS